MYYDFGLFVWTEFLVQHIQFRGECSERQVAEIAISIFFHHKKIQIKYS